MENIICAKFSVHSRLDQQKETFNRNFRFDQQKQNSMGDPVIRLFAGSELKVKMRMMMGRGTLNGSEVGPWNDEGMLVCDLSLLLVEDYVSCWQSTV